MRAVVMEARGGPEVLKPMEMPTPEPGPKEVRIRVRAAGPQPPGHLGAQGGGEP
jgi:NADPH:quinone reductase-like Zn-dependent oxidoreductase